MKQYIHLVLIFLISIFFAEGALASYASVSKTILPTVPDSPIDLTFGTITINSIQLNWTDNSGDEEEFEIFRSLDAGGPFASVGTTLAGVTTFNSTGLASNTEYFYRVYANNVDGPSTDFAGGSATTLPNVPAAPTNLTFGTITNNSIQLNWNDNSSNEVGFEIFRSLSAGGTYTSLGTTGAGVATFSSTGLASSTAYFYTVYAFNADGPSVDFAGGSATTLPNVPAAPTNLTFGTITNNSIQLNWNDNSSNEVGFEIFRSLTAGGTYTSLGTTLAGVATFNNTGLTNNTAYHYRVYAYNLGGPSAGYADGSATTFPNVPAAPSGLTFGTITNTSIQLNWTDISNNEDGFEIFRSLTAGGTYTSVGTTLAGVTTFNNTGLTSNTAYHYRVYAYNLGGPSAGYAGGNATTLPNVPAAPTNLTFTNITISSIRLNWTDNSDNEVGFEIFSSLLPGGPFTTAGTTGAGITTFNHTLLNDDTQYFYQVMAYNTGGNSGLLEGSASTLLKVPDNPTNLIATANNTCSVDLNWDDISDNEEGFVVQRSNLPAGVFVSIQTLAADSESFTDTGTENNKTYYYRIRAFNGAGEVFSNVAMVAISVTLTGGIIAADQEICPGGDPALIINSVSPSGGSSNWSYQWQSRIAPALFTDIPLATGLTYNPPAGTLFTTEYQRISTVECGSAASNIVVISVDDVEAPQFTLCPADEVIEIERNLLSVSFTTVNPVFTDNCAVTELTWSMSGATIGNSPLTGINYVGTKVFQLGVTTVTYVAKDLTGNSESCQYNVTVKIKDPEILNVTIPNATMKIGDIVSATIVVSNDGNSVYTLASGDIGGYPLASLVRSNSTTYLANFVIVEGGNSYEKLQNIPVGNLVVTDGITQSLPYTTPISQNNDLLDAKRPVVTSANLVAGNYKIGGQVVINIQTDGVLYTLDPASTVNGMSVTQTNMAFVETGAGMYRLTYTVEEGDDDVAPGAFEASLIFVKPSGNIGNPYTALGNVAQVSVDAHAPLATRIEVPDVEVGVGGVVVATITADGTGYTAVSGTLINGIPLSSNRVNFTEISNGLYTLTYEVSSTDNVVAPGELEMSIVLRDLAGNIGEPFGIIEVNELEVYTQLPQTHLATLPEICEGEQAELVVYLVGREPFSIELFDGNTTLLIEDIDASPFSVFVSPLETTWYSVPVVKDRNGVENAGSGSVQVTVNASTAVNFTNLKSGYSVEASPFKLTADIPGGVFSGPGVNSVTGYFSPAVADTLNSPHTLYYTYVNPTGCTSMDSALVFVLGANGDVYIPRPKVCDYNAPFLVSASNVAGVVGTFTLKNPLNNEVTGLTDHGDNTATIDPVQLAGGVYTVEYAYTDIVKLYIRENFELIELTQPEILSPSGKTTFCQNEDAIQLIASDPAAVFSGNGVSGNVSSGFIFDPSVAPAGENTISCKVSSETGCEKVTELVLTVYAASVAKFTIGSSCLPDSGGMVSFNNQSTSKLSVETWRWDFGDPLSGADNYSGEIDPQHFYPNPGEWSVSLTATTYDGCVSGFQVDALLSSNPQSDFTWISDCFVNNQGVEFVNLTPEGFTPIESMKWIFMSESGDILDEVISDSDTLEYLFPNASTYLVRLQAITQGACIDTVSKMVELRPTFKLNAEGYSEAFDLDQGGWTIESEDGNASWVWGTPDFEGYTPDGNEKSWYTELSGYSSGYVEHSWIQSPCFDFSDMDRPMIMLDMMKSFVPNVNGSVLQFMKSRKEGWQTVGASSKGINWYNSVDIFNHPGGSPVGWSLDVFSPDTDWVEASHDLGALKGSRLATLRLAIATTGAQGIGNQGFAFDNLMISEKTKLSVLEHFTNSSDQNSFSADIQVDAYAKANRSEVIDLQYHTAYPGEDPMNLNNPGMVTTRAGNLGVGLVPYAVLDGGSNGMYRYDFSSIENIPGSDDLDLLSLTVPSFEIEVEVDWTESDLTAYTTVTCTSESYPEYIQLYVVVMESLVTPYEGTNGDSAFRNVVLEMLPTPAGKLLGQNWSQGDSVSMANQWTFEPFVEDIADLVVVAFVQDRNTKEILQAAVNYKTPPTGILDRFADLRELQVYPNPAKDYLYVNLGSRTEIPGVLEVFDLSGRMVLNMETQPGYQIFNLDIQYLTRGMYIIRRIESGVLVGRSKFIKTQ